MNTKILSLISSDSYSVKKWLHHLTLHFKHLSSIINFLIFLTVKKYLQQINERKKSSNMDQ